MKHILSTELNKPNTDIQKLTALVILGKPKKLFGFIKNGYEDLGLFKPYDAQGNNLFHILAAKNVLAYILPEIFTNATQICQRENITEKPMDFLRKFIDATNSQGLKPAHIAIQQNNPATLDILHQYGVGFTKGSEGIDSPIEYIFSKQPQFLNAVIKQGFTQLLELLCNQANMLNILNPALPRISKQIKISKDINMHQFFLTLFEFFWESILADDQEKRDKINSSLDVVKNYTKWGLSKENLAQMLNIQNLSAKSSLLRKYAQDFLDNTEFKIPFITEGLKIDEKILHAIQQFIDTGITKQDKENTSYSSNIVKAQQKELNISNQEPSLMSLNKSIKSEPKLLQKNEEFDEYITALVKSFEASEKSMKYITKQLGSKYSALHLLVSMSSLLKFDFDPILTTLAKAGLSNKNTADFLKEYTGTLNANDLLAVNAQQKINAYNLASMYDDLAFVKLLLQRGIELGVYDLNTSSIFEMAIASKSVKVLQYLLTEQESVTVNWHEILYKGIKYGNTQVAQYYIQSNAPIIELTTDRKGTVKQGEKYTICNKILNSLVDLSQVQNTAQEKYMHKTIDRILSLYNFFNIMMDAGKVYFSQADIVHRKTVSLLETLSINIANLNKYSIPENVTFGFDKLLARFRENGIEPTRLDTQSATTYVSNFSALSGIDIENKTLIGNTSELALSEQFE